MSNNDEEEGSYKCDCESDTENMPMRVANESLRVVIDKITNEESLLSTLCTYINMREILSEYDCLKEEDWDRLLRLMKNNREEITKQITELYGGYKLNGLMSILVCHPPLEVVKLIVELGGKETVTKLSECDFNAIHYACWGSASLDVIRYIVEVGVEVDGKEAVLQKSLAGGNPLHYACNRYKMDDSNSLCDVIRLLIEVGKYDIVTSLDKNCEMPLQSLLLRTETPVDSVITLLDQWYLLEKDKGILLHNDRGVLLRKEPNAQFGCYRTCIGSSSQGDETVATMKGSTDQVLTRSAEPILERASEVNESFKKINQQLVQIDSSARGRILKTKFMKEYLTERFIQRLPLAVLIIDLFSQVLVVSILSFGINNTTPNSPDSASIKGILWGCVLWRLFRELIQLIGSSLCSYLDNISNWIDVAQILLIFLSLDTNLDDHSSGSVRWVLVFVTALAWFELLFELQNFYYNLAVFVYGAINIMSRLKHFFITMIIFVAMFAHVYYIASTHDTDFCNNTVDLTEKEFDKKGAFQCTRIDSYVYSFTNVVQFEPPYSSEVHWLIPMFYSFVMGILFVSIVVGVIFEAYGDVKRESEMTFWFQRLQIVNELEFLEFLSKRFLKPKWMRQSKNPASRMNLSLFLPKSAWDNLEEDEDKVIFHWWYGKTEEKPTPKERLGFFLRRSCWRDIFMPSNVFESILLGENRSYRSNAIEKCITLPSSVVLLVVSHILVVLLYIFGGISFGMIWPETMKRYLFSDCTTSKSESERKKDENTVMREENRMLREELRKRDTLIHNFIKRE